MLITVEYPTSTQLGITSDNKSAVTYVLYSQKPQFKVLIF